MSTEWWTKDRPTVEWCREHERHEQIPACDPEPDDLIPWTQPDGTAGRIAAGDVRAFVGYVDGGRP